MAVFRKLNPGASLHIAKYIVERHGGELVQIKIEGYDCFGVESCQTRDLRTLEEGALWALRDAPDQARCQNFGVKILEGEPFTAFFEAWA